MDPLLRRTMLRWNRVTSAPSPAAVPPIDRHCHHSRKDHTKSSPPLHQMPQRLIVESSASRSAPFSGAFRSSAPKALSPRRRRRRPGRRRRRPHRPCHPLCSRRPIHRPHCPCRCRPRCTCHPPRDHRRPRRPRRPHPPPSPPPAPSDSEGRR